MCCGRSKRWWDELHHSAEWLEQVSQSMDINSSTTNTNTLMFEGCFKF